MERRQHVATIVDYQRRIAELERIVDRLSISPWFNCLTRVALNEVLTTIDVNHLWLCYFDVDKLKYANEKWGKIVASQNIAQAIKPRAYDILGEHRVPIVGQWFSGDEFVALLPQVDVLGYANRVQRGLHRYQMSATFVLLPSSHKLTVFDSINYAENVIKLLKGKNLRNLVVEIS